MNKITAIKIVRDSAIVYENQFVNKNLLIVFGNIKCPDTVEIKGSSSNFLHLTGMKINTPRSRRILANQCLNECDIILGLLTHYKAKKRNQ